MAWVRMTDTVRSGKFGHPYVVQVKCGSNEEADEIEQLAKDDARWKNIYIIKNPLYRDQRQPQKVVETVTAFRFKTDAFPVDAAGLTW
jgi:hypothetical protein